MQHSRETQRQYHSLVGYCYLSHILNLKSQLVMANRLKKESNRNRNNDKIQCQLKKMVLRSNKEFLRYKKKRKKKRKCCIRHFSNLFKVFNSSKLNPFHPYLFIHQKIRRVFGFRHLLHQRSFITPHKQAPLLNKNPIT